MLLIPICNMAHTHLLMLTVRLCYDMYYEILMPQGILTENDRETSTVLYNVIFSHGGLELVPNTLVLQEMINSSANK